MVYTRKQQYFLSYYSISLPLKSKDSFQGMVIVSPASPYQVLMITQSLVSFENRWTFFFFWSHSCSWGNVPPSFDLHLVSADIFHEYIRPVFFFHVKKFSVIYKLVYLLDISSSISLVKF